jgi:hypothetical protein
VSSLIADESAIMFRRPERPRGRGYPPWWGVAKW